MTVVGQSGSGQRRRGCACNEASITRLRYAGERRDSGVRLRYGAFYQFFSNSTAAGQACFNISELALIAPIRIQVHIHRTWSGNPPSAGIDRRCIQLWMVVLRGGDTSSLAMYSTAIWRGRAVDYITAVSRPASRSM